MVLLISILVSCWSCNQQKKEDVLIPDSDKRPITQIDIINDIERIEPKNWWVGYKNTELQLLVKHPNISQAIPQITHSGVSIIEVHQADSPNYLFIDLNIDKNTRPGQFNISFKIEGQADLIQTYELKPRKKEADDYLGFNSSDVLYLITPDRFANADPSNDIPVKRARVNESEKKNGTAKRIYHK